MMDFTQHLGVLSIHFFIPAAQSLKDKRMALRSLKDRIRKKFNVSIAQLDREDKWQTAVFGIAMVGNDRRYIDGCLQNILSFAETYNTLEIIDHEITFF